MTRFVLFIFALLTFSGYGMAQTGFGGPSLSGVNVPNINQNGLGITLLSIGGQVGVYNLAGPLGLRATADYTISPISGPIFLSGDLLLSSGGSTNIYGGAGFGIITLAGATAPIAKGFVGAEFAVSDGAGIFVEVAPNFAIQTGNFFIGGRAGANFYFGIR